MEQPLLQEIFYSEAADMPPFAAAVQRTVHVRLAHILAVPYDMLGSRCLSNACQAWGCARLHAQGLRCAVLSDTVVGKRLHIIGASTVKQPGYTDMRHACYLLLVGTSLAKNNAGP